MTLIRRYTKVAAFPSPKLFHKLFGHFDLEHHYMKSMCPYCINVIPERNHVAFWKVWRKLQFHLKDIQLGILLTAK